MSKREFKVGDKVRTHEGEGKIILIDKVRHYLVDFGEGFKGHSANGYYHRDTCLWYFSSEDLTLIEPDQPTTLQVVYLNGDTTPSGVADSVDSALKVAEDAHGEKFEVYEMNHNTYILKAENGDTIEMELTEVHYFKD